MIWSTPDYPELHPIRTVCVYSLYSSYYCRVLTRQMSRFIRQYQWMGHHSFLKYETAAQSAEQQYPAPFDAQARAALAAALPYGRVQVEINVNGITHLLLGNDY